MTVVARKADSFCVERRLETLPDDPATQGGGRITIGASVGLRGTNRPDDTRTIQNALNSVPSDQGRAAPPLVPDGKIGPKTIKAIQMFQIKHFGFKGADGRVDPGAATIAQLNLLLGGASFPDMSPVLRVVRLWLLAVDANLVSVDRVIDEPDTSGPFEVFGRPFRMRLINKHFSIDAFPNKRQMFALVRKHFQLMGQTLQRPGGLWGSSMFDRDPLGKNLQAYTIPGGFFRNGKHLFIKGHKLRADAVYLTARFANELRDNDRRAFVVIHELAHFVSTFPRVRDHAHNKQGDKIRNISPTLKVLNAETYANFAWEVVHGSDAPVF